MNEWRETCRINRAGVAGQTRVVRQLLPVAIDPVDPVDVYRDSPGRTPSVRLNMIASADGATTLAGLSGGLGGPADHQVFMALRSLADAVLVAAGTVRAEG